MLLSFIRLEQTLGEVVSLVVLVEMEVMEENREATLSTKFHLATTEVHKEEMRARRLMGEADVANYSKISHRLI